MPHREGPDDSAEAGPARRSICRRREFPAGLDRRPAKARPSTSRPGGPAGARVDLPASRAGYTEGCAVEQAVPEASLWLRVGTDRCPLPGPTDCPKPARPGARPARGSTARCLPNPGRLKPAPHTAPPNRPAIPEMDAPSGPSGQSNAPQPPVSRVPHLRRRALQACPRQLLYHKSACLSHPHGKLPTRPAWVPCVSVQGGFSTNPQVQIKKGRAKVSRSPRQIDLCVLWSAGWRSIWLTGFFVHRLWWQ